MKIKVEPRGTLPFHLVPVAFPRGQVMPEDASEFVEFPEDVVSRNVRVNYHQAVEAQRELMQRGFAPLNPMATMTLPFAFEEGFPHELWIACDLPWVEAADAVLRLPGESAGADMECEHAVIHGVPVFHSVGDLEAWRHGYDQQGPAAARAGDGLWRVPDCSSLGHG